MASNFQYFYTMDLKRVEYKIYFCLKNEFIITLLKKHKSILKNVPKNVLNNFFTY